MEKTFHILNGDVLKDRFPNQISGEIIIARECLVDGPVDGESLDELLKTRAIFIAENYEGFQQEDYYQKTVPEFMKIQNIPSGSEINLWFEDDLFCQVNLWFVCSSLKDHSENCVINLVRPDEQNRYNFGRLSTAELLSVFKKRKKLTEIEKLAKLWKLYQQQKTGEMLRIGRELANDLQFVLSAIQAHIDSTPSNGKPGRPVQTLEEIREALNTDNFAEIFREFSKRESIYGFGDLQVKRLLDKLKGGN